MKYKIGDWIRPTDPVIDGINYGYNLRLVIDIFDDDGMVEFVTVSETFGIEENLWNEYNTEFVGRIVLEE